MPKRPLELNHWTFVSGTMVGQLPQGKGPLYDIDALLEHIAADVAARPGEEGGVLELGKLLLQVVIMHDVYAARCRAGQDRAGGAVRMPVG